MALIDKASLLMVPSTYEAGTLYNVLPSGNRAPDSTDQNSGYDQTRADFTFDRGSNTAATRVNANGLIEKYRENLLTYSNDFSQWINSGTTETSGQEDKDGGTSAWLLDISGGTGSQYIGQNISVSGVQTFSFYAKAGSKNWVMCLGTGASFPQVYFDLQNGVIGTESIATGTIESVGNGWYRCSMWHNIAIGSVRIYIATADNDINQSSGNIYLQNAQLESGLVATDYLDSGATTAKAGVLIDLPRINYDANGENGSLLLEPSRQNLLQYSEYFGGWTTAGCSISANYAISPEGIKNAYLLTYVSGGSRIYDFNNIIGTSLAISVFVKGVSGDGCHLLAYNLTSSSVQGDMTFSGNTFTKASGSYSAKSESVGDGWYRVSIVLSGFTSGDNIGVYLYTDNNSGTTSGSSLLAYGFQAEPNASYPSSYIPNHGESGGVTRAADVNTLSNAISLDGDFALFWEGAVLEDDIMLYGSGTTAWYMNYNTSNGRIILDESSGRKVEAYLGSGTPTGVKTKILIKRVGGVHSVFANGTKLTNTTSVNSTNTLSLSSMFWGYSSSFYKGLSVNQSFVSKTELTDAECVTLTTL